MSKTIACYLFLVYLGNRFVLGKVQNGMLNHKVFPFLLAHSKELAMSVLGAECRMIFALTNKLGSVHVAV